MDMKQLMIELHQELQTCSSLATWSANTTPHYRMLLAMARKLGLNYKQPSHIPKMLQEIVKVDQKPPQVDIQTLNYFTKRINVEKQSNILSDQQINESAQTPQLTEPCEIESLQQQGKNYTPEDQIDGKQIQVYDIEKTFLISDMEDLSVKELSQSFCGLANQPGGGSLLICGEHENLTISRGIKKYGWKDHEKLRQSIKKSLEPIVGNQNIQVKVKFLPVYLNNGRDQEAQQFLIKINVFPKPDARDLFYIQQEVDNFKIIQMKDINKGKLTINKVQGQKIYELMVNNVFNSSKFLNKIPKNLQLTSKVIFNFNQLYDLVPLLQRVSKEFSRKKIQNQFTKIKQNQIIVQFEHKGKLDFEDTLHQIRKLLSTKKRKYNFFVPFQDLQKELNNFQNAKPFANILFYFAFEGSFNDFRQEVQDLFGDEFDERVVMSLVHENITTVKQMSAEEVAAFKEFMWKYQYSIPDIKKYKRNGSTKQYMRLIFKKINITATVFAFFLLALTKKRPY